MTTHSSNPQIDNSKVPPEPEDDVQNDEIITWAMFWSLIAFGIVAIVGGGVWWWLMQETPVDVVEAKPLELPEIRDTPQIKIPSIPFTDITTASGITFRHENGAYGDKLLPETMGGGCALFDIDNDGDSDLLLVNSMRWPWDTRPAAETPPTMALYLNDGTGNFADVTEEWGLNITFYGMGTAIGDYDNDGKTDLFISALGANRLYHNTGSKFIDVTAEAGVAGDANAWSTSTGWFDYDNDGDLDLFVCNCVIWTREFDISQNFQLTGGGRGYGRPQAFNGTFPYLYRNEGNGTFTDVTENAQLQVKNPATGVPMAKSLGLTFTDANRDGFLDIMVANDTVQNFLFENLKDSTFSEIGAVAGVAFDVDGKARGAMGIDSGFIRNNDAIGVAIGNFSNEMTALYVTQGDQMQFSDEAVSTGLGPNTRLALTFGVLLADWDLDGRLDYLAANGHLEDEINKVQSSQFYEQSPHLFWNAGPEQPTEFLPVPADNVGNDFDRPLVGRGVSCADIDGDGDLDILITATGQSPRVLRNDQKSGHHWLRIVLQGTKSNRSAIGTLVEVHAGGKMYRQRLIPTRSYLSQTELVLTFGLGYAETVDEIVILWPSGETTTQKNVGVDQRIRLAETLDVTKG
ncbi:MAG: CRTAC1 family protein [Planctomycetota bacterium]|nr:CRTAC1 family protein [Planctomycetota bacterium]MDA1212520.1 CRTAC1 family protein [Planctomycetota bacterium]